MQCCGIWLHVIGPCCQFFVYYILLGKDQLLSYSSNIAQLSILHPHIAFNALLLLNGIYRTFISKGYQQFCLLFLFSCASLRKYRLYNSCGLRGDILLSKLFQPLPPSIWWLELNIDKFPHILPRTHLQISKPPLEILSHSIHKLPNRRPTEIRTSSLWDWGRREGIMLFAIK